MRRHSTPFLIVRLLFALLLVALFGCFLVYAHEVPEYVDDPPVSDDAYYIQKEMMQTIKAGLDNGDEKINLKKFGYNAYELKEAVNLFCYLYPADGLYLEEYRVVARPNAEAYVDYLIPGYAEEDKVQFVKSSVQGIVSEIDPSWSDLHKVCWINSYICANFKYDDNLVNDTVYDMLSAGTGICGSYTELFALLANEIGLETSFAVSDDMAHAWNLVKIDGQWYNIDTTWNDGRGGNCYLLSDEAMVAFHNNGYALGSTVQFELCEDKIYDTGSFVFVEDNLSARP